MTRIEFQNVIVSTLKSCTGVDEVTVRTITKNNGVELTGISPVMKDSNVSPTVYVEDLYYALTEGEPLEKIVAFLHRLVENNTIEVPDFKDFNALKYDIFPKVVGLNNNSKLLATHPHRFLCDLLVLYYIEIKDLERGQTGTVLITDNLMSMWNVSEEELYKIALANLVSTGFDVKSLGDIVSEFGFPLLEQPTVPLYVVTNAKKYLGANALLSEVLLNRLYSLFDGKFVLLPSSIHEVIVTPFDALSDTLGLVDIVKEVNRTQVDPQEILSDNVYVYDGKQLSQVL